MAWLGSVIAKEKPEFFGLHQRVWTLELIRKLILQELHLDLSRRSVGRLLQKFGLNIRRPSNGLFQSSSAELQSWIHGEFTRIRESAERERAEIVFVERIQMKTILEKPGESWFFVALTLRGNLYFQGAPKYAEEDLLNEFLTDLDFSDEKAKIIILFGHP